jgi:hypothetical protein
MAPRTIKSQSPKSHTHATDAVLEQLRDDPELMKELNVTPDELHFLDTVSLLGGLKNKKDIAFILKNIRSAIDHE